MILHETGNIQITKINEELISVVERLLKILDHNRTTVETRAEINKTICEYLKQMREFQMHVPFEGESQSERNLKEAMKKEAKTILTGIYR